MKSLKEVILVKSLNEVLWNEEGTYESAYDNCDKCDACDCFCDICDLGGCEGCY